MTDSSRPSRDHPSPDGPVTPDERLMLAYVEGELDEAGMRKLRALAERDPSLARRLEAMRADRKALRSLKESRAPASLVQGIRDEIDRVLERELLLRLSNGRALEAPPPKSAVRPRGGAFADPLRRRFALAAGVFLAAGVGVWAGAMAIERHAQRDVWIAEEAMHPAPAAASREHAAIARAQDETDQQEQPQTLARAFGAGPEAQRADQPGAAAHPGTSHVPSLDVAVSILVERRLVIRARARDASSARLALERVGAADNPERLWALDGPVEPRTLARLAPVIRHDAGTRVDRSPVGASDGARRESPGTNPDSTRRARPMPEVVEARLVEVDTETRAIASLLAALREQGLQVRLEAAGSPLDVGVPADPSSLLWWSRPPGTWQVREAAVLLIEATPEL